MVPINQINCKMVASGDNFLFRPVVIFLDYAEFQLYLQFLSVTFQKLSFKYANLYNYHLLYLTLIGILNTAYV